MVGRNYTTLSKSSETIDDMKSDSSADTDSSSENTCSSSEENSDNVTFYRWQIVEKKITKSKVDDCNWNRTHNHLVHKRTINHLAKLPK